MNKCTWKSCIHNNNCSCKKIVVDEEERCLCCGPIDGTVCFKYKKKEL